MDKRTKKVKDQIKPKFVVTLKLDTETYQRLSTGIYNPQDLQKALITTEFLPES